MLERPVFITGCGRSGTTILGETLSHHPSIAYLNEPRDIWEQVLPQSDLWSAEAIRNGKLYIDETSITEQNRTSLTDRFSSAIDAAGRQRLVEKLPENSFRMRFIEAVFPDAMFIHIIRDGREVARSIAQACSANRFTEAPWYGIQDAKWQLIRNYCQSTLAYRNLPSLCFGDYERGLLEWRLNVEAALAFCKARPTACLLLRYEEFLANPVGIAIEVQEYIGVNISQEVNTFASKTIRRMSPQVATVPISKRAERILDGLLESLHYR